MKKTVCTTMTEKDVTIVINGETDTTSVILPFTLVSPQTSLHIAASLSQDATIPRPPVDLETVRSDEL